MPVVTLQFSYTCALMQAVLFHLYSKRAAINLGAIVQDLSEELRKVIIMPPHATSSAPTGMWQIPLNPGHCARSISDRSSVVQI